MQERIIGIDLGTTNSLAATVFEEGPDVVGNPHVTPSVLYHNNGQWIVGNEAQAHRLSHPKETIHSVKRLMGHGIEDLQEELPHLPYDVVPAQRQLVKVQVEGHSYTPQEVSAEILKQVKREAEKALEEPIHKAVITVPAYFDDAQRQATRDAGKLAGLEVVRILNEPTAAAIAYGLENKQDGWVIVYDLGGGTFDVSVLKLSGKVFQVVGVHGDTRLGGDDVDRQIMAWLEKQIAEQGLKVSLESPQVQQQLRQTAEQLKMDLSASEAVEYHLVFSETREELPGILDRTTFNGLIEDIVKKTLDGCEQALKQANVAKDAVSDVVLVGGSTCIPYVRQQVESFFQKPPHIAIDPYKVVAIGAGIQGHLLAGGRRDFLLLDVVPLALGIETLGGTFNKLIMSNSSIPCEASELFTTHVDDQTAINLNIYQGERELVQDCRCLGKFQLKGIPPMRAGLPKLKVQFSVDSNGILKVSAFEERSQQQTEVEVIPSHGLTHQEIDQILEDSFEYAVEDFNSRQLIEFRNTVSRVFQGIEEHWEAAKSILSADEQSQIRNQMDVVKTLSEGDDPKSLKEAMNVLGDLTRPLADAVMSSSILDELSKEEAPA